MQEKDDAAHGIQQKRERGAGAAIHTYNPDTGRKMENSKVAHATKNNSFKKQTKQQQKQLRDPLPNF